MNKKVLLLSLGLLFNTAALAETNCFIAKEENKITQQEGDCRLRYAPCSTFKIDISLMGYNEGLLIDETYPELPFKQGYPDYLEAWKAPQTPCLWMKNSCVWYSQVLTQQLGMKKIKNYVSKLNYGNKDVSGDKGQNNGLTHSWLSSSLDISSEEQIIFLQKLLNGKLPVSAKSHNMTKNILYVEELPDGWKLYGKTGSGVLLNQDRTQKLDIQHGWFIGFIQKNDRTILFAARVKKGTILFEIAGVSEASAKAALYRAANEDSGQEPHGRSPRQRLS